MGCRFFCDMLRCDVPLCRLAGFVYRVLRPFGGKSNLSDRHVAERGKANGEWLKANVESL
jgi:hypothetical protein